MRLSRPSCWCAALLAATLATPVGLLRAQAKPAAAVPTQTKPAPAATATPPPGTNADTGWPRTVALSSGSAVWHQPQIESWTDQKKIVAWSAVSFLPTGAKEPALGTIKIEGDTQVSVDDRVVRLDLRISEYNFRTLATDVVKALVADVQALPPHQRVLDLDRLLAYVSTSPLNAKDAEGIKADPPIVFSAAAPAMLINLDGDPIWSPIKDVDLRYALNTNWDLFEHPPSKTFYVRNNASWLQAPSLVGPWTAVTGTLPDSFGKLPADDNWKDVRAALPGQKLNAKTTPKVFVSTTPAELILLEGPIGYVAVPGATSLLWVNNTEADLFRMGRTGAFYFLVAGRWFSAPSLDGPWTFTTTKLPEDFQKISIEHPRSRVLASVPGTPQAIEAVVLASIPRTARVNKKELKAPDVAYSGDPQFTAIDGANGVARAENTDKDIVRVGTLYYMCYQAVWFVSKTANGPWEVATSIPPEVYSIPASSPAHHVTYVTVEDDDDEWATFAYGAAYTGLMIGWGCAVWGSGWSLPAVRLLRRLLSGLLRVPAHLRDGRLVQPVHRRVRTRLRRLRSVRRGRDGRVLQSADRNLRARRRGLWPVRIAFGGPGLQPAHRHLRADPPGLERLRQLGQQLRAARRRLGADGAPDQLPDRHPDERRSDRRRRRSSDAHRTRRAHHGRPHRERRCLRRPRRQRLPPDRGRWLGAEQRLRRLDPRRWRERAAAGPRRHPAATQPASKPATGTTQSGQLDRDRNAREKGNQRATDRSGWQTSGATRSGAGSYGGARGGGRSGGGGRRR